MLTAPLNLPALGRRQSVYSLLDELAQTCVFSKQLPEPILCGPPRLQSQGPTPEGAPLIPKLRGNFAEFLNNGSLERLRILTSPTCVSFGTDTDATP